MSGTLDLFAAAEAERQTRPAGEEAPAGQGADQGAGEGGERVAYSVSALNRLVRQVLDETLPPIWVGGEIGNWTRSHRGHCYFSLKDENAQVRCVLFQSDARRLPAEPENGMRVRVFGAVTLYEQRGDYQLVVRELEAKDAGGLFRLAFERLRAKLQEEGLLDPARKRPLPRSPRRVGVVTSSVGAAFHDVTRVIEHRAPWTTVVLSPARVQGDGAEAEIAAAIRRIEEHGAVDVVIVGRGGGSTEDLWAFNKEEVARAIAGCGIPVISAVGHEVDVTIADLVADRRAATPSAAAELAVMDGADIKRRLATTRVRLAGAVRRGLDHRTRSVESSADAMRSCLETILERRSHRLGRAADRLNALSPLAALRRGYAVAQDAEGRVLRTVEAFPTGSRFRLRVADGRVDCVAEGTEKDDE